MVKAYSKNEDYNLMLVTPVDNTKELRDDFSILYDRKKKMIIEVSSFISPKLLLILRIELPLVLKIFISRYSKLFTE
ncbi:hypothetical protein QWY90_01080 [Flavobacterium paronense]|uniref:hypothetical protein n=1 Tax=Flavobacterium paronense TaxID=1392775 RepID=UPI0025B4781C|nr:hypothetical protein [Flavobacterium paronense]MDN3675918.1 hypothetical protein [Flavobacterium paronense]